MGRHVYVYFAEIGSCYTFVSKVLCNWPFSFNEVAWIQEGFRRWDIVGAVLTEGEVGM